MRFILDANMPRSALRVFAEHGHAAVHVNDAGMSSAADSSIAAWAGAENAVLVSRDLDFADVRVYPPDDTPGLLVLRFPDDWTAAHIVEALDRFLRIDDLVSSIPGRLVILDRHQVRFRPALT